MCVFPAMSAPPLRRRLTGVDSASYDEVTPVTLPRKLVPTVVA
jgi:hypothetical protein